jgi:hypothetical protein
VIERWWLPAGLALALLGAAPAARAGLAEDLGMSEAEAVYCESELAVVQNRLRIFRAQGLPPAEQRRRNAAAEASVYDCRRRYRELQKADVEDEAVRAEVARRLPPNAGEVQRDRAEREVRLERARAKPRSALRDDERKLLAAEEDRIRRERAEADRVRDPRFRRPAVSALLCLHQRQLARARTERADEERLGVADRNRAYYLKGEIRRLEENVAAEREELAGVGGPMACSEPRVAALERCAAIGSARAREDETCQSDELQDLVRVLH